MKHSNRSVAAALAVITAAIAGAACSRSPEAGPVVPTPPDTMRAADDAKTPPDETQPDDVSELPDDTVAAAAAAGFHATYAGACGDPAGGYEDVQANDVAWNPEAWLGKQIRLTDMMLTHPRCTRMDCPAGTCCNSCGGGPLIGTIQIMGYECTGDDCDMQCNYPDGSIMQVWGTLEQHYSGILLLTPDGSCSVPFDEADGWQDDGDRVDAVDEADEAIDLVKDIALGADQCWTSADCTSPGKTICSLTHQGMKRDKVPDECSSDAECGVAGERCVSTSAGRRCTPPGVCERCCKPSPPPTAG